MKSTSKGSCPVCGRHAWNCYEADKIKDLEMCSAIQEELIIDMHLEDIDWVASQKFVLYVDECTWCGTTLSL
jgi:hypothetical protein